ncbi:hypothetical protein SAMN05216344_102214 [Polaromonas sp. OV174]|uniref:hypothetical protein n=1 Tax=Polaromonas sp. OV174 TaxID=1855300 RepID=UPI0008EABBF7|nr:hypothetical protein [Polaromonas sp. OV174]SFB74682.1 hypothetical protein SAMN05216344_102214 [Polaromonas sp. OV174]
MTTLYTSSHVKLGTPGALVRELIASEAKKPVGYSMLDKHGYTQSQVHQACRWLIEKGLVFKGVRSRTDVRFFDKRENAEAYQTTRAAYTPKPEVVTLHKSASVIYPPGYKHTRIPTPAPQFQAVDLPFVHSGMRAMQG